jgi:AraC family transcriptional regulator of adaptative response/methylated-DNA-[protein]-cysteine methyltransferase
MRAEEESDYARVEKAIRFLDTHHRDQPRLEDVAEAMGLSAFHAQRVFARWAGVSPKQFLGLLTLEDAKQRLGGADSVLDAALEVGLSGPSRLHDLFVKLEAVTPGEYKAMGEGLEMRWGVHPTPFGDALFVATDRGLAHLAFIGERPIQDALDEARAAWPLSRFDADPATTLAYSRRAFRPSAEDGPLRILVQGTPFQVQVWRALLRIPLGRTATYGEIARAIGQPSASRAVGLACGRNRLAFLVPCHRVIRETGALGGYHWGKERKQAMLAWEAAQDRHAEEGRPAA